MNAKCKAYLGGKWRRANLTTERAESSYGLPVVVVGGQALGSAEVGPLAELAEKHHAAAERAGYTLAIEGLDLEGI